MSSEHGPGPTQDSLSPPPADDAAAVAVAPQESSQTTAPQEAPAPQEPAASDEAEGRRVRLNPVANPNQFRPIPTIQDGHSELAAPESVEASKQETKPEPEPESAQPPRRPAQAVEIPRDVSLDAETEAEIAAAIASGELEAAVAVEPVTTPESGEEGETAEAGPAEVAPGAKFKATVQSVHGDNVFVDFGQRTTGVISLRQFNAQKPPQVGDKIDIVIDRLDENEGLALCNLPRGRSRISGDWDALSVGQVVDCMVEKTNKGGLEVKISSLRGFMPASQVEMGFVANLDQYVGQKLRAQITEVKPARRRLILSRRAILAEERQESEREALQNLQPGQQLSGRVKTIKDYGVFIDLGGVDGFLHIGQMSWARINHPSEIVQEGQQVEVQVLTVDKDTKKISLGMRQLAANPWALASDKYAKGTTVTGKVSRTEAFGAFIELEPGLEGLVHISELDHKRVKRVTEVLHVGQTVEVQVLEVDPGRKRISMSVKALKAKPEVPKDEDLAPGKGESYERKIKGPLKGGTGSANARGLFGNPQDFHA